MFNSTVLDVGIGLVLVYLILGLVCTTVNEWIAQMFKLRAQTLKDGIDALLARVSSDGSQCTPADLHVARLVQRLTTAGDKLAAALGLDPAGAPGYDPNIDIDLATIGPALAARINAALANPSLWEAIDIAKVSAKTLAGAKKQSSVDALRRANLALLREAYPEELGELRHCFYNHPLVKSLCGSGGLPSYIPCGTFAMTLLDILGNGRHEWSTVKSAIDGMPEGDVKRSLQVLAEQADGSIYKFRDNLANWFQNQMDRVSGWYKKKVQIITVVVALGITILANADTLQISRKLYQNPALRQKVAQEASITAKNSAPAALTPEEKAEIGELTGWSAEFISFHELQAGQDGRAQIPENADAFPGLDLLSSPRLLAAWLWAVMPGHLLGWFLTCVAVSLGAPFWFDVLSNFMNVRSAGQVPAPEGQNQTKT